jgi:hypothetical protein
MPSIDVIFQKANSLELLLSKEEEVIAENQMEFFASQQNQLTLKLRKDKEYSTFPSRV